MAFDDLQGLRIDDHDPPVDGREVDQSVVGDTVMNTFTADRDASLGVIEGDGVAHLEPSDERFAIDEEDVVGVSAMGFEVYPGSIVDVRAAASPTCLHPARSIRAGPHLGA